MSIQNKIEFAYIDAYGSDPTGNAPSDSALDAALKTLGGQTGKGIVVLGPGTYKFANSYTFNSPTLGITGSGAERTSINFVPTVAATFLTVTNPSFIQQVETFPAGAPISGFSIDGTNAPAGSQAIRYGDRVNAPIDLVITNFSGSGSVGIRFDNQYGWCEQLDVTLRVSNCADAVFFDNHSSTPTYAYSKWNIYVVAEANQNGLVLSGSTVGGSVTGAQIYRSDQFVLKGACKTGASNTGTGVLFSASNASLSDNIQINLETNGGSGGSVTHKSIDMTAGGTLAGHGELVFQTGNAGDFQAATLNYNNFGFIGKIDAPGDSHLTGDSFPGSFSTIGAPIQYSNGYGGYGTIYLSGGDVFVYDLASGAQTIALNGDTGKARNIKLILKQPGSGAAGTVSSWPFTFINGLPILKTANNAVDVIEAFSDGSGNWYAIQSTSDMYADVDAFGADPTGVNDSTTAFVNAQATGKQVRMGVGTYKIGTSSDISIFGRGQGLVGPGSGLCTIEYYGAANCIECFDSSFSSSLSMGGQFGGFYIDGSNSLAGAVGMRVGDMNRVRAHDITIANFSKTGGIGINFMNSSAAGAWAEESEWTAIKIQGCVSQVVFDTGSFDYSVYQFLLYALSNQNGVVIQNNAQLDGVRMEIRGNFQASTTTTNTGACLAIDPNSSTANLGSELIFAQLFINVETDATASGQIGHIPIILNGSDATTQLMGTGILQFLEGGGGAAWQAEQVASSNLLGFTGQASGLKRTGKMQNGDGLTVIGGSRFTELGGLTYGAYAGMYIYPELADVHAFLLSGSITIGGFQGDPDGMIRRMEIFFQQPAAGGAVVTWPTNVKFAGGNKTLSTAGNAIDKVTLTFLPSDNVWMANIDLAYA